MVSVHLSEKGKFMSSWFTMGAVQYERNGHTFTGWYRNVRDRRPDGVWPEYRVVGDCIQVR